MMRSSVYVIASLFNQERIAEIKQGTTEAENRHIELKLQSERAMTKRVNQEAKLMKRIALRDSSSGATLFREIENESMTFSQES